MKKGILAVVHESAKGLHKAGLVNKKTIRTFDNLCVLPSQKLSSKKNTRTHSHKKIVSSS